MMMARATAACLALLMACAVGGAAGRPSLRQGAESTSARALQSDHPQRLDLGETLEDELDNGETLVVSVPVAVDDFPVRVLLKREKRAVVLTASCDADFPDGEDGSAWKSRSDESDDDVWLVLQWNETMCTVADEADSVYISLRNDDRKDLDFELTVSRYTGEEDDDVAEEEWTEEHTDSLRGMLVVIIILIVIGIGVALALAMFCCCKSNGSKQKVMVITTGPARPAHPPAQMGGVVSGTPVPGRPVGGYSAGGAGGAGVPMKGTQVGHGGGLPVATAVGTMPGGHMGYAHSRPTAGAGPGQTTPVPVKSFGQAPHL